MCGAFPHFAFFESTELPGPLFKKKTLNQSIHGFWRRLYSARALRRHLARNLLLLKRSTTTSAPREEIQRRISIVGGASLLIERRIFGSRLAFPIK
jgi:hypothetical protein